MLKEAEHDLRLMPIEMSVLELHGNAEPGMDNNAESEIQLETLHPETQILVLEVQSTVPNPKPNDVTCRISCIATFVCSIELTPISSEEYAPVKVPFTPELIINFLDLNVRGEAKHCNEHDDIQVIEDDNVCPIESLIVKASEINLYPNIVETANLMLAELDARDELKKGLEEENKPELLEILPPLTIILFDSNNFEIDRPCIDVVEIQTDSSHFDSPSLSLSEISLSPKLWPQARKFTLIQPILQERRSVRRPGRAENAELSVALKCEADKTKTRLRKLNTPIVLRTVLSDIQLVISVGVTPSDTRRVCRSKEIPKSDIAFEPDVAELQSLAVLTLEVEIENACDKLPDCLAALRTKCWVRALERLFGKETREQDEVHTVRSQPVYPSLALLEKSFLDEK